MFDRIQTINENLFFNLNFEGGPALDLFFWIVTSKIIWIPLYLFIFWLFFRKYGAKKAIIAGLAMGLMVGLIDQSCNLFKDLIPTLRPSHRPDLEGMVHTIYDYWGGLSGTASAHAAISFGIALFSSLLVRKRIFTIAILLWALLVAYSRVYSGMHFPMDIFIGMVVGMTISLVMHRVYLSVVLYMDRRSERRSLPQVVE